MVSLTQFSSKTLRWERDCSRGLSLSDPSLRNESQQLLLLLVLLMMLMLLLLLLLEVVVVVVSKPQKVFVEKKLHEEKIIDKIETIKFFIDHHDQTFPPRR